MTPIRRERPFAGTGVRWLEGVAEITGHADVKAAARDPVLLRHATDLGRDAVSRQVHPRSLASGEAGPTSPDRRSKRPPKPDQRPATGTSFRLFGSTAGCGRLATSP